MRAGVFIFTHFIIALSIIFGDVPIACAQYNFDRWDDIAVNEFGQPLSLPWAGGLNNPQFSKIDLNGDGIRDLFVFDRNGDRIIPFINNGSSGTDAYTYAPELVSKFPALHSWVLLRDYDGDGKKDIFTSAYKGVRVYRNDYNTTDGLQFTMVVNQIQADSALLWISEWDVPGIEDVDGDGDIDILTFEFGGSFLEYYKNLSVENYGTADSLVYTRAEGCWGLFAESWGDCSVTLNVSCKHTPSGGRSRHAGSTTLILDLNGDTAKELIIGDITCTNTYMLTNTGTPQSALIGSVDVAYPAVDPIDINRFPAAFYEDVDNDGVKDLLAAPNALNISENITSSYFYKNNGTDNVPVFSFQQNDFLQDQMIEVGEDANPVFFDYNADSLPDLIIGGNGYYNPTGPYSCGLALYENTGVDTMPSFKLITKDYMGLSTLGLHALYPAFGDLDGDGDKDMIFGEADGNLYYFENTAGAGNTASFTLTGAFYENIDVGQNSTPQLVDVNRDGMLDLLIGEHDGYLNLILNNGSVSAPDFSGTMITNLGGVDTKRPSDASGYSVPYLTVLDTSGVYSLLVGTERGTIYLYTNIDGNLSGNFTLADTMFLGLRDGGRVTVSGEDLNRDGAYDICIGNADGGIHIMKNLGAAVPPIPPPEPPAGPFSINIYPNPAPGSVTLFINSAPEDAVAEVILVNLLGQKVLYMSYSPFDIPKVALPTAGLAGGIYFCSVNVQSETELEGNLLLKKLLLVR